ncbi:hypothetical protein ACEPPN_015114 [Leptodophora sp. 'Broadleaf-Isolate-01']
MILSSVLMILIWLLMSLGGLAGYADGSGDRELGRGGGREWERPVGGYGREVDSESSSGSSDSDAVELVITDQNRGNGTAVNGQPNRTDIVSSQLVAWRQRVMQDFVASNRTTGQTTTVKKTNGKRKLSEDDTEDESKEPAKGPKVRKQDRPDYGAIRPMITEAELAIIRPGYRTTVPRVEAFVRNETRGNPPGLAQVQVSIQELYILNYLRTQRNNTRRPTFWPAQNVTIDPEWEQTSIDRDVELVQDLEDIRAGVRDGYWDINKTMSGSGKFTAKKVRTSRVKALKNTGGRSENGQSNPGTCQSPVRHQGNPLFQMLLDAAAVVDAVDPIATPAQRTQPVRRSARPARTSPLPPSLYEDAYQYFQLRAARGDDSTFGMQPPGRPLWDRELNRTHVVPDNPSPNLPHETRSFAPNPNAQPPRRSNESVEAEGFGRQRDMASRQPQPDPGFGSSYNPPQNPYTNSYMNHSIIRPRQPPSNLHQPSMRALGAMADDEGLAERREQQRRDRIWRQRALDAQNRDDGKEEEDWTVPEGHSRSRYGF